MSHKKINNPTGSVATSAPVGFLPSVIAAAIILINSCATTLPQSPPTNYGALSTQLQIGMDKSQVMQILGGPPRITSTQQGSGGNLETWTYYTDTRIGMYRSSDPYLAPPQNRLRVGFDESGKVRYWGDILDMNQQMADAMRAMPELRVHQTIEQAPAPSDAQ